MTSRHTPGPREHAASVADGEVERVDGGFQRAEAFRMGLHCGFIAGLVVGALLALAAAAV